MIFKSFGRKLVAIVMVLIFSGTIWAQQKEESINPRRVRRFRAACCASFAFLILSIPRSKLRGDSY